VPVPRSIARLNRVGLNQLTKRIFPWLPGFGVVVHVGRRSGRSFETPVNVFQTESGARIALTYGEDSDWVKNVVAADGCVLRTRGQRLAMSSPRVTHDPDRTGARWVERPILRLLGVDEFLDLSSRS
jgi:deazaflavin-dependent oxidoreductase (nitroreductase family)